MEWLKNIGDPTDEFAKYELSVAINESRNEAWVNHLLWLSPLIIGRPKATERYTVAELERMDMVGVYRRDDDG